MYVRCAGEQTRGSVSCHMSHVTCDAYTPLRSAVCCSVLQCVAVCCSVLQGVAVCCSVLQCVAVCCSGLQNVAVCCSMLQYVATCCNMLQCVAVCCSVIQYVAVSRVTRTQHTATYCNTARNSAHEPRQRPWDKIVKELLSNPHTADSRQLPV